MSKLGYCVIQGSLYYTNGCANRLSGHSTKKMPEMQGRLHPVREIFCKAGKEYLKVSKNVSAYGSGRCLRNT